MLVEQRGAPTEMRHLELLRDVSVLKELHGLRSGHLAAVRFSMEPGDPRLGPVPAQHSGESVLTEAHPWLSNVP